MAYCVFVCVCVCVCVCVFSCSQKVFIFYLFWPVWFLWFTGTLIINLISTDMYFF